MISEAQRVVQHGQVDLWQLIFFAIFGAGYVLVLMWCWETDKLDASRDDNNRKETGDMSEATSHNGPSGGRRAH